MYQPDQLNDLIAHARLNGDKEILHHLTMAQKAMELTNFIERAPDQVKLGWRGKCLPISVDEIALEF